MDRKDTERERESGTEAERDNKGVRKKRWKISWNGIKVVSSLGGCKKKYLKLGANLFRHFVPEWTLPE